MNRGHAHNKQDHTKKTPWLFLATEGANMAAMEAIDMVSCTVVGLPSMSSDAGLHSHDFLSLVVPSASLTMDPASGVSINVKVLLSALLSFISGSDGEIPPFLCKLLVEQAFFPTLRVSTTRCPIFDHRMQNSVFGYCSLGFISRLTSTTGRSVLIRAIDSGPSDTAEWMTQLTSLHVRLTFHFILVLSDYDILNLSSSPASSRHSSPQYSSAGPSSSPQHYYYPTPPRSASYPYLEPSPLLNFDDPMSYNHLTNLAYNPTMGTTSFPADIAGPPNAADPSGLAGWLGDLTQDLHAAPQAAPGADPAWESPNFLEECGSQMIPDLSMEEIFVLAHITPEEQSIARFKPSVKGLWQMIQTHSLAAAIVKKLCLPIDTEGGRVKFSGGKQLTTSEVVGHLGWSIRTFTPPERVLHTTPVDSCRKRGKAPPRSARSIWCGTVAMFGVGGFSEQASPPLASASDAQEIHAATLSQNEVYHIHEILKHLRGATSLHLS
ncbi:hypothetical protein FB451DRAFT_1170587 [Mycena latifolia]|nr:hypothetical protein FB451DRAFT_1170587 [Mycena latifolia]